MSSSSHCPPPPPPHPNQTKRMSLVDFATAVWNAEFSFLFIFSMICGLAMLSGIAANMAWWPISSTSWPAGRWSVTSGTCRPCTDGWDKPTDIYSNFGDSGWNYPALKVKAGLWGDWNGPALKVTAGLWGGWNDPALITGLWCGPYFELFLPRLPLITHVVMSSSNWSTLSAGYMREPWFVIWWLVTAWYRSSFCVFNSFFF